MTLTELVVVASIITIFAVSSLPFLGSIIPELKSRGAAEQMVEVLRNARQNAIGTTATYRVIFPSTQISTICTDERRRATRVPRTGRPTSSSRSSGAPRSPRPRPRSDSTQGLHFDRQRQRARDLPERHDLAGGGEYPGPRALLHGDDDMSMTHAATAGRCFSRRADGGALAARRRPHGAGGGVRAGPHGDPERRPGDDRDLPRAPGDRGHAEPRLRPGHRRAHQRRPLSRRPRPTAASRTTRATAGRSPSPTTRRKWARRP